MRTLALSNQKGGSAKTTTAVSLAAALGELGHRVLVVDLDPQASASAWFGATDAGRGLLDVFTDNGNLSDLVSDTDTAGVSLVAASTWLAGVDKALAGEVGAELAFREALAGLPEEWDFVLVDCPPALGFLTISALCAVDAVLVPVEASAMAMAGLAGLLKTVERVQSRMNPALEVAGILVCRVDARTNLSRDVVEHLRERFDGQVFDVVVRETVRLREAWSFAKPITEYDPRGHGAEDYRAAAAELLARENRSN